MPTMTIPTVPVRCPNCGAPLASVSKRRDRFSTADPVEYECESQPGKQSDECRARCEAVKAAKEKP